ncbi:MAG: Histidine phosphatase superfamily (branch 1) [Methanomassiliicoccales archaeon PtaU1.Bin124]|nr:MAG: Histidine phosphatase superfamily (branch 1) [Methanomassiliicoccales archaeon PtaU1.Bin124]
MLVNRKGKEMEPIRISSDLSAVPDGANCAVIIRHGDRGGGENKIVNVDEELNETGRMRSELLGGLLSNFTSLRSYSSPIGRCMDTCVHISKGYGTIVEPKATEFLGMSAPFMVDPNAAYAKMKQLGLLGFVDAYVHDSLDRNMVLPCMEGTEMMFNNAIEHIKDMRGGVGVFVTHDMIITPAMAYFFGFDFRNGLAPFLDGIVLYSKGNGYAARHGGKEMAVSMSGKPLP